MSKLTLFCSLFFIFNTSLLFAIPKYLRLSYTGETASTIAIVWNTDIDTETIVKYGKQQGSYTHSVQGTSFKANGELNYIHEVLLTGLEPDTVYFYIAGSNIDGFSEERIFKTGPEEDIYCADFNFGYLGDNRPDPTFGGGENWPQILEQCAAHKPNFLINGGDLVIDGDKIDQWVKFLGWTEKVASTIPLMPTIGNHDDGPGQGDTANYNQIFALPRSSGIYGSNTEDYYYFTYGNAIFISLSTQTFKDGNIPFEKQAKWLDEVLTKNPKKWKFVYYHHPTYTKNVVFDISHPPNEVNQNSAFVPIFDKHHVDIVFTSHNHWYERFEPSACSNSGKPDSDQPCSVGANNFDKGTVYIVSGGAGAFTIPGLLCGSLKGRVTCTGDHHYINVKIKNETLIYEAYSAYPQQNKIMDSFTITKSKDNCLILDDAGYKDIIYDSENDVDIYDIELKDIHTDILYSDILYADTVDVKDEKDDDITEDIISYDSQLSDIIEFADISDIYIDDIFSDTKLKDSISIYDIAYKKDSSNEPDETSGCGCNNLE